MSDGSYQCTVGNFQCISLSDGYSDYPPKNFFANVEEKDVQQELKKQGLPLEYIRTPYTYLFVDTGDDRILVDMGICSIWSCSDIYVQRGERNSH